jgi:SGNH domain (fused to AT3 domains)
MPSRAAVHVQIGSRNMTSVSTSNSTGLGSGVSALQPAQSPGTTELPLAMLEATRNIESQTPSDSKPRDSDAFLSYTHRDRQIATGIQAGPHQTGQRLGQAASAFRDDTNLAVNLDLWGTAPKNSATRRAVWRMSAMLSALAISLLACSTHPANISQRSQNTPSAGGTYATTAQVLEAVKAAEQVQTLPDALAASLRQADTDEGGASGCFDRLDTHKPAVLETHQPASDITFGECASGDQNGTKLMVMLGDSRADMFSAPLELIAAKAGWKLRVFAFSGCQVADLEFSSLETNAPNKECGAFRSAAINQIGALHPNLVIITSAGDQRLADGTVPTHAQLQDAWVSTFQKLGQPGTRLAMIGPIPVWNNDDARCLAAHESEVQACTIATAEVETNEYEAPQAAAAAAAGVVLISPRPWVCADRCEPVIANIQVYRERYHFSRTYAVYLTGALSEALQPAMA